MLLTRTLPLGLALAGICLQAAASRGPRAQSEPIYDYLLRNGHVIDPAGGRDGRMDIAIAGDRVVRFGTGLPAHQARRVIDLSAYYVTPGLIDLHAYVNSQAVFRDGDPHTDWRNVNPDHNALRHGVTTVVDGGSTGWRNFESFKTLVVDRSRVRVLAFLNIVGAGMLEGQAQADPADLRVEEAVQMARRHKETIVGIRSPHLPGAGRDGLDRSLQAAESIGGPALVEYHEGAGVEYGELVLERLRAGDLVTHTFGPGTPVLDAQGRLNGTLSKARERGVLFDLGHGSRGFWFRFAVPAVRAGFLPDTLSTAMDKTSLLLPRTDMMTTLSKFLNMGIPVQELVDRATARPARALKRPELGTLREGGLADLAVIEIQEGQFGFLDAGLARLRGDRSMRAVMTMREGRIVWDSEGLSRTDWSQAGPYTNYR
jgi:dihydroorotase